MNPRPPQCECDALPTALQARCLFVIILPVVLIVKGQGEMENTGNLSANLVDNNKLAGYNLAKIWQRKEVVDYGFGALAQLLKDRNGSGFPYRRGRI